MGIERLGRRAAIGWAADDTAVKDRAQRIDICPAVDIMIA